MWKWLSIGFVIGVFVTKIFTHYSTHNVGLYQDMPVPKGLLAIFPSPLLGSQGLDFAMRNCQSTIDAYKDQDKKNGTTSLLTHQTPVYFCKEI